MKKKVLISFTCGLFLIISLFAGQAVAIPVTAGLVGYWPGDGNADDLSGNSNNGTLKNGATFGTGVSGQAFSLDGTDDYVTMGDPGVLDMGTSSFSISLWYQTPTSSVGNIKLVNKGMSNSGTPLNAGYDLTFRDDGLLHFRVIDGTTFLETTIAAPTLNTFHHVAGVLDRSASELQLYVDGSLASFLSFSSIGSLDTNLSFAIGALDRTHASTSITEFFEGQVDEVALYNRTLSVSEIEQLALIPEPATIALLGIGLAGMAAYGVRRRRQRR